MKNINIEISDNLKLKLEQYSNEHGIYIKKIVELALVAFLLKGKK